MAVTKGAVATELDSISDSRQRAERKAQRMAELLANLSGRSYTYQGVRITITTAPTFAKGALWVTVAATQNGVPLPLDNPYGFGNPPILIPDGTTSQETGPDGKTQTVPNFKEDLAEALRTIVGDAVIARARALGWAG